jgi:excisionase family DNA binding protein
MIPFGRTQASVAEAAEAWGVSTQAVRMWIRSGKLNAQRIGNRFILSWPQERPAMSTLPIQRQGGQEVSLFPEE